MAPVGLFPAMRVPFDPRGTCSARLKGSITPGVVMKGSSPSRAA